MRCHSTVRWKTGGQIGKFVTKGERLLIEGAKELGVYPYKPASTQRGQSSELWPSFRRGGFPDPSRMGEDEPGPLNWSERAPCSCLR
jgi:hypothetical protein